VKQVVQVFVSVFSILARMGTGWVRKPDRTGNSGADITSISASVQDGMSLCSINALCKR
jgi:hypothetical protein